jgi:hypothetical protein
VIGIGRSDRGSEAEGSAVLLPHLRGLLGDPLFFPRLF